MLFAFRNTCLRVWSTSLISHLPRTILFLCFINAVAVSGLLDNSILYKDCVLAFVDAPNDVFKKIKLMTPNYV